MVPFDWLEFRVSVNMMSIKTSRGKGGERAVKSMLSFSSSGLRFDFRKDGVICGLNLFKVLSLLRQVRFSPVRLFHSMCFSN